MAIPSTGIPASMAEALSRMWARFLPEIEHRVVLLEQSSAALACGTLSVQEREAAHHAAHKLAGILGTFGLPQGTDLARQAEHLLESDVLPESIPRLASLVADLRSLLDARKA